MMDQSKSTHQKKNGLNLEGITALVFEQYKNNALGEAFNDAIEASRAYIGLLIEISAAAKIDPKDLGVFESIESMKRLSASAANFFEKSEVK